MRRIRYLTLLVLLLGSISIWAQDDFNPADPPEPGLPPMKLEVVVSPAWAGSVSGAGRYAEGTQVNLHAYTNTGFRFVNWTNSNGEELSTSASFTYTKGAGHELLTANYEYDPSNPSEPVEPSAIMYYQLQLIATDGGSVSGGGRYLAGQQITLQAYPESKFEFVGWYDEDGECISTNARFTYTTTPKHRVIEGRFYFNPDSPSEPPVPVLSRLVTATANEGGSTNFSSQYVKIGSSITISAYTNTGYQFVGWYLNNEFYTNLSSFSYTVTDSYYQNFEARFEFNPASPPEPNMPVNKNHAFYLMNKVTSPGKTVLYPIYLSCTKTLNDMTFQLEFPQVLTPDFENVQISERATGYSISYNQVDETNYMFSLIGGEVPAGNAALLVFTINVPDNIVTGANYPIKINQVTVTEENNNVVTASTRNGRVSIYKWGDTNGDDSVDALDVLNMVTVSLQKTTDIFIEEVSDLNSDGNIDAQDVLGVVEIALEQ